jgi:plastocyanin
MGRGLRYSILPAVAALSAFFVVLPTTGADARIKIVDAGAGWAFSPATVRVEPGARIAFVNQTGVTHAADCDACPWTSGDVEPGQTRMVTFPSEIGSGFHCRYHPELMTGSLTVGTPPSPSPSASGSA